MTRDQIRARIDALECLDAVQTAICDLENVEWEPGESQLLDINVTTRDDSQAVTFVLGIPPAVLLAGLEAMRAALMAQPMADDLCDAYGVARGSSRAEVQA